MPKDELKMDCESIIIGKQFKKKSQRSHEITKTRVRTQLRKKKCVCVCVCTKMK